MFYFNFIYFYFFKYLHLLFFCFLLPFYVWPALFLLKFNYFNFFQTFIFTCVFFVFFITFSFLTCNVPFNKNWKKFAYRGNFVNLCWIIDESLEHFSHLYCTCSVWKKLSIIFCKEIGRSSSLKKLLFR